MTDADAIKIMKTMRRGNPVTQNQWIALSVALRALTELNNKNEVANIFADDLKRLRDITEGCRPDMHEPDEQNVTAEFGPTVYVDRYPSDTIKRPQFDNADSSQTGDLGFWLVRKGNCDHDHVHLQREWFNLADIIALARREV